MKNRIFMIPGNEEEFKDPLGDFLEVQVSISRELKKVTGQLDEHGKQFKLFNLKAEEQYAMLETLKQDLNGLPDKEQLADFTKSQQTISANLQVAGRQLSAVVEKIPEQVQAQVTHRFEGRLKWMMITIAGSILVTSLSLGLYVGSWRANTRLRQQDIKYRYLKRIAPVLTLHADTLFLNDPKGFSSAVQKWEFRQERIQQAEQEYRQKQREADEAKKKLKQVK